MAVAARAPPVGAQKVWAHEGVVQDRLPSGAVCRIGLGEAGPRAVPFEDVETDDAVAPLQVAVRAMAGASVGGPLREPCQQTTSARRVVRRAA